jgi:hypothetical protein
MRPRTVILEAFEDWTGEVGLGVEGVSRSEEDEMSAAREGMLIAHDLIEHVNGVRAIGSIDDELEAMGAIWYVRGQHGDMRRDQYAGYHTPESSMAADLSRMFSEYVHGKCMNRHVPRTRACDWDDDLRDCLQRAKDDAHAELKYQIDADQLSEAMSMWPFYERAALALMRTGLRKVARRFKRIDANGLFWLIAGAVQPYCKSPEEWQRFELTYGERNGRLFATCHEHYPEEDY